MMTDPIADMLTRIRNAVRIERTLLDMPASKMRRGIAQVLKDEGYIWDFEEIETVPSKTLRLHMKYGPNGERLINRIDRVSKPGRRVYMGYRELKPVLGGMGIQISEHAAGSHQRPPRAHRKSRRRGAGLTRVRGAGWHRTDTPSRRKTERCRGLDASPFPCPRA